MTIEQRVERMFNPGGSTPVGTGFPLVPFASLPAASTVEGQVRRLTELPHVSLIALGGIWRPFGGRQVLAQRSVNPVTVQNLAGAVAETIGPFPGGLVRGGMALELDSKFRHDGIGAGTRIVRLRINSSNFCVGAISLSGAVLAGRLAGKLDVVSDTSASHTGGHNNVGSYTMGRYSNISPPLISPPRGQPIFF